MGLEQYKIVWQSEEKLTIYNEENCPIGTMDRKEAINKGLLVEGVQLWIINPNTNQVLMQRRSRNKHSNPGKIDVSVSGHVKPNETATQAILREASEEIGLKDSEKLFSQIQKFAQNQIDLRQYGRQGNYVMTYFVAFLENSLKEYIKDTEEVEELFFMNYQELKRRVRAGDSEMLIPKSKEAENIFSILDEKIQKRNKAERCEEQKQF